ncbi:MAG: hypothetical protein JXO48_01990 [Deltaproteobacteria bacterium]|nr:hypothetical protein [Deltaproteobacteria bacterium]
MKKACWVGLLLLLFGDMAVAEYPAGKWSLYRHTTCGYSILYPATWEIVEAGSRSGTATTWSGLVLLDGERQKVTFLEQPYHMWQGQFEIRVMENEEGSILGEWLATYDVRDINEDSLITETTDTTLAGHPAVILKIFLFDHEGIEIIAANDKHLYLLSFAGQNPNDPDFETHREIYEHMISSFRFE